MSNPWIGVDLDGTLAEYNDNLGAREIGPIVPIMKQRILDWIEEDICEVKIFTARVAGERRGVSPSLSRKLIQNWLEENGLPRLEVTNEKTFGMVELYDDRAVQVKFNEGTLFGESTMKYRNLLKDRK